MIKNPKKNYSLKGKPLSTKIAFVVICVFIFSLFIGSIGGLVYLFKSFKGKPFSVSAETVSGSTTTITTTCVLDVSSISYDINDFYVSTLPTNQYALGSISRPLTLRAVTDGLICHYFLDLYLYNNYTADFDEYSLSLDEGPYVETPFSFTNYYYQEIIPLDFAVNSDRFKTLDLPATVLVDSVAGSNEYLVIKVTDVKGNEATIHIYPSGELCTWSTHPFSGRDFSVTYYINPFDIEYVASITTKKYQEGFDAAMVESDKRYESIRQEAFDDGKMFGYNEAISKANDYSFYNLMDAITYAPLKVFISLFNFEFLGINLLSLVTFILSVVVVLGIVKFFL